jgi:hypothetical protein
LEVAVIEPEHTPYSIPIVLSSMVPDHVATYGLTIRCRDCGKDHPSDEFRWINRRGRSGKVYRTKIHRCRRCTSTRDNEKLAAKQARWMLKSYRKRDREAGFSPTDLDYKSVEELVSQPCSYCEDTELTMTLDRVDNNQGHVRANVLPACFRCQMLRGSMPYKAWLRIAKVVKEVRLAGLFGEWIGPSAHRLRKRPGLNLRGCVLFAPAE